MKRILKLLIPVIVIAATVMLLCLPASAASEMTYAVYNSESDYRNSPENPLIKGTTSKLMQLGISSHSYIVLYSDIKVGENITITNSYDVTIDLNGHTLTCASSFTIGANAGYTPTKLTIKDGSFLHTSAQCFKGQPNSTLVFDNVKLTTTGGVLFRSDGFRGIHFINNSELRVAGEACKSEFFPPLDYMLTNIANVDKSGLTYTQNLIFENSRYIDLRTSTAPFFSYMNRANSEGYLDISFLEGSGFTPLGENFINNQSEQDANYVHLNIEKGATFAEPTIPIDEFNLHSTVEVTIYNDIIYDNGHHTFFEPTSLLEEGEEQVEGEFKKLIWGYSGNDSYPYRLCHKLCDVVWVDNGTETEVKGYADGVKLKNSLTSDYDYYFVDDKVYYDVHIGWSMTEDMAEYSEYAHITDSCNFYSVYDQIGPASVVEFTSPSFTKENIKTVIVKDKISAAELSSFSNGSYVLLYTDVALEAIAPAELSSSFTLDLAGHSFTTTFNSVENYAIAISSPTLNIKNGTIRTTASVFAAIQNGGTVILDGVNAYYDILPLFDVKNGTLTVTDSKITSLSYDELAAALILGNANVTLNKTELETAGILATHRSTGSAITATLTLNECASVKAESLFAIPYAANGTYDPQTNVTVSIDKSFVDCGKTMDIPVMEDGTSPIQATLNIMGGTFANDPRSENCAIVLPEGKTVVCLPDGSFTVGTGDAAIKMGYTLMNDLAIRVYVPATLNVTYVSYFNVKIAKEDMQLTELGGESYYLAVIGGIAPSDALATLYVDIAHENEQGEISTLPVAFTPVEYFAELLTNTDTLVRKLSASAMRYVAAAYSYVEKVIPADFAELLASDAYISNVRDAADVPERNAAPELGNISLAFSTAQLYLSGSVGVRFNLRADFSGEITVMGETYTVENGMVNGNTHVTVTPSLYEIYKDAIKISGSSSGGTAILGEYSLSQYISDAGNDDPRLAEMLNALYASCYEAFVNYNGGVIPPYIEHTPVVDVEHRVK